MLLLFVVSFDVDGSSDTHGPIAVAMVDLVWPQVMARMENWPELAKVWNWTELA